MKTHFYQVTLILLGMFIYSCTPVINKQNDGLSPQEISSITNEIVQVTDNWGIANNAHDVNGSKALWLKNKDFRLAENGILFKSHDSLSVFLDKAFSASDSLKFKWIEREVFPLTTDIACFAGTFEFALIYKDGSKWAGTNALTATFLKSESGWKVMNGHESTKIE